MKYLTHNLKKLQKAKLNDYKCINCNVKLYQLREGFFLIKNDNSCENLQFVLNCNEVIIKNILE